MDEPCSALDPIATRKIEELMQELKKKYTIAIVTHNLQQAKRVADMTAFLYVDTTQGGRTGYLVEYGATDADLREPDAEAHAGVHPRRVQLRHGRRTRHGTSRHEGPVLDYDRRHGDDDGLAALLVRRPPRSLEPAARRLGGAAAGAPARARPARRRVRADGAWWTCDGTVMGMYGLQGPMKGYSAISRAGIEDDGLRASNPTLRLRGHGSRRRLRVGDLRPEPLRPADRRTRS